MLARRGPPHRLLPAPRARADRARPPRRGGRARAPGARRGRRAPAIRPTRCSRGTRRSAGARSCRRAGRRRRARCAQAIALAVPGRRDAARPLRPRVPARPRAAALRAHRRGVAQLERTLALAQGVGPAFSPPPAVYRALAESLRAAGRTQDAERLEARARRRPSGPPPAERRRRPREPRRRPPRSGPARRCRRRWQAPRDDSFDAVFRDLDALIGLAEAKAQFRRLAELLRVNQLRRGHGLKTAGVVLHMVFVGGPGTGKTTLARLVGRLYHALELLETRRRRRGHARRPRLRLRRPDRAAHERRDRLRARQGAVHRRGLRAVAPRRRRRLRPRGGRRAAQADGGRPRAARGDHRRLPRRDRRLPRHQPGLREPLRRDAHVRGLLARRARARSSSAASACRPTTASPSRRARSSRGPPPSCTRRATRSFANARTMRNLFDDAIAHQAQRLGARGALRATS